MSDYSPITDYSAKDALTTGDPEKTILGADVDAELDAIAVAIATKYDSSDLASQAQAEAGALNTVLMTPGRVQNWGDANAGVVGDLRALTDPGADRLMFWDDSAGAAVFLSLAANELEITGTELGLGSNVPLLNAANTFTADQKISGSAPILALLESDAAADNQLWRIFASAERLRITAVNDAETVQSNILDVERTGTTVDSIALTASAITLNGVNVTDYARLSQANTFSGKVQVNDQPFVTQRTSFTGGWAFQAYSSNGNALNIDTLNGSGVVVTRAMTILQNDSTFAVEHIDFPNGELRYGGTEVGFRGTPVVNPGDANYTLQLSDKGKTILGSGLTTTRTWTIPANASVAFPTGTVISLVNRDGVDSVTIAITSDTLVQAGTGATGSRTLGPRGVATLIKTTSTEWLISGTGLS